MNDSTPIDITADLTTDLDLSLTEVFESDEIAASQAAPLASCEGPQVPGYVFLEKVGRGTLGEVWKAQQVSTGQRVAVKLFDRLPSETLGKLEEAMKLGSHPYLITILDANLSHSPPFLVTSLLDGSLHGWVKSRPHSLELNDQIAQWLRQAGLGLAYMHRRGLFHGAIKPANLLLDSRGVLRMSDFGRIESWAERRSGFGLESIYLLSPEQVLAANFLGPDTPTPGWDIYSLGATFYYLLTGAYPRATLANRRQLDKQSTLAGQFRSYWVQVQSRALEPIRTTRPQVDTRLALIVERCLSQDPRRRYGRAEDLVADLDLRLRLPQNKLDDAFYSLRQWRRRLGL